MATYCVDNDLLIYRSNILSLGVSDWEIQRQEAFSIINRMLVARWYNKVAPIQGIDPSLTLFDSTKVSDDQLKRLECFKTLEFAYMILMKDSPEADGFERNMKLYADLYVSELDAIVGIGLTYDWDGSGDIDSTEVQMRSPRRVMRA